MLNCIYTRKLRHNCEKSNLKFQVTVKKNLVLLGMMGVGKTTIGKIVAKKQGLEFVDTDTNIEKKCSMKISEIFKKKGEEFFRLQEEKEVLESLKKNNLNQTEEIDGTLIDAEEDRKNSLSDESEASNISKDQIINTIQTKPVLSSLKSKNLTTNIKMENVLSFKDLIHSWVPSVLASFRTNISCFVFILERFAFICLS